MRSPALGVGWTCGRIFRLLFEDGLAEYARMLPLALSGRQSELLSKGVDVLPIREDLLFLCWEVRLFGSTAWSTTIRGL